MIPEMSPVLITYFTLDRCCAFTLQQPCPVFPIHRLEDVLKCDRHFSLPSSVGESTKVRRWCEKDHETVSPLGTSTVQQIQTRLFFTKESGKQESVRTDWREQDKGRGLKRVLTVVQVGNVCLCVNLTSAACGRSCRKWSPQRCAYGIHGSCC